MSEALDEANAEVIMGIEVEKFLETTIGRYILGCGDMDEKDAIGTLLNFDPYEYSTLGEIQTALAKMQQNVHIARKVHGYLSDAIVRGNQAEEIIANSEE